MSASLSVCKGVMMIGQVEAAMGSYGMKLMILQIREHLKRCFISTMKLIVWIFHLIMGKTSLKATLIKCFIVSYQRQVSHIFRRLVPHFRKNRCVVGVFFFYSMNLGVPIAIMIWNWFYETVKSIHNLPVFHNDDTDAACASDIAISRLEVDSGKVREIGNYDLIVRRFRHLILLFQHGKYQSRHLRTYILKCNIDLVCHRLGTTTMSLS